MMQIDTASGPGRMPALEFCAKLSFATGVQIGPVGTLARVRSVVFCYIFALCSTPWLDSKRVVTWIV